MESVAARSRPTGAGSIVEALRESATDGGGVARADVIETHVSRVFLVGDRAYKLKKPVLMPFLDYRELDERRRCCFEEVRLNQRLAPDLYIGVRAIAPRPDGRLALAPATAPDAIEYVVEMHRFASEDTLAERIRAGRAGEREIAAVARRIAEFHRGASPIPARDASDFRQELASTLAALQDVSARSQRSPLARLARRFDTLAAGLANELGERAAAGLVRDCHGDLRAEHVLLGEPVQIFDCIEFDPRLRQIDIACDVAFLAMDLERLAGRQLAATLLSAYREAGGDPGSTKLATLFAGYRACVRAKVAALRAEQLTGARAAAQRTQSAALARLAWRFVWRLHTPIVIVLCGPAASGKTYLARELAAASGLPHLSSDVTRKRLAGLAPTQRGSPELYRTETSMEVYGELGRRAAESLERGGAIVDATFRRRDEREIFRAQLRGSEPIFVECLAPPAVILARARQRLAEPGRESDAGPDVAARQLASFEALAEIPLTAHLEVRTNRPVELVAADVEAAIARRRRNLS